MLFHFRRLDPHDAHDTHETTQVVTIKSFGRRAPDAKDGRISLPLCLGSSPTPPPRAGDGDRGKNSG